MSTFAEIRAALAGNELRDSGNATFLDVVVGDLVNAGLAEVSRIIPVQFQEDIPAVADTLTYQLQADALTTPDRRIEVTRVEVWDGSQSPAVPVFQVNPASGEYINFSQTGWRIWAGMLELPNAVVNWVDPTIHVYRVWGYRPMAKLVNDADVFEGDYEQERAVRDYAALEGIRRLVQNRALFTQWQTRSNNSDVTPASLLSDMNLMQQNWRARKRELFELREVAS